MKNELLTMLLKEALSNDSNNESINSNDEDFEIGKQYLIRTVTMIQVGKCIKVTDKFITLENASWVADTKRFNEALKNGLNSEAEIEPFGGPVKVAIGAIVDVVEYSHKLPTEAQ